MAIYQRGPSRLKPCDLARHGPGRFSAGPLLPCLTPGQYEPEKLSWDDLMLSGDRKIREFSNLEADSDEECWRNEAGLVVRYTFHDRKFHKSEALFKKTEECHLFFQVFVCLK